MVRMLSQLEFAIFGKDHLLILCWQEMIVIYIFYNQIHITYIFPKIISKYIFNHLQSAIRNFITKC